MQICLNVPPLKSEDTWDFRARLSGSSSVAGPGGEHIEAIIRLFSEPMHGTLTGASLLCGNSMSELECSKGHYACVLRLKPLVQHFRLPEAPDAAPHDAADGSAAAADDGADKAAPAAATANAATANAAARQNGNAAPAPAPVAAQ
jgi:hypothetical protein